MEDALHEAKRLVQELLEKVIAANPHDPIQDNLSEIHAVLERI